MKEEKRIKYLSYIKSPESFKAIPTNELSAVADEIREELVRIVTKNGGHLASNLGAVELTMAIHRVFNTPKDHVIFDVGHQSYVHKMLTGRYEDMENLRQPGGISGFMKRDESEHDCFGAGHSSTSISAALGFAVSDKLNGSDAYTVAVIGDGAYTGGMAYEALNNCQKNLRLIIILNENEMSISKNVGKVAKMLSKIRSSPSYFKTKSYTGRVIKKIPLIGGFCFKTIKNAKMLVKNTFYGTNYFENMGLTYMGPIDGNDYAEVEKLLKEAKKLDESVIVHVKTKKGKGYKLAENEPAKFHGMSPAAAEAKSKDCISFSCAMGHHLIELGAADSRICAITAAMSDGTGLEEWRKAFPERFFDVGIAEEHALTFAAGLSANGMKPCTAIYSTFLQRGYDNIIHDIALQELPVVMAVDRAGLNPKDGATHHGIFDVSFLSQIPHVKIYTPVSVKGLLASMDEAFASDIPCAIRYPNGYENSKVVSRFYDDNFDDIGVKSDIKIGERYDAAIITHGRITAEAISAVEKLAEEGITVAIILLEVLKPYGEIAEKIKAILPEDISGVLFLEEEIKSGGMGMNFAEKLREYFLQKNIKYSILATDDTFAKTLQKGQNIYELAGVDAVSICKQIKKLV